MTNESVFHVIKDPVHGTMQFTTLEDHWIKPFIDSPYFQRLRHIKQLGMGDFIFPGAVHTRFNHCIGCCYIASQIAHQIGLAEEERQLVMIACLLHDIGHGPFSHTFEDIFHQKLIRHEEWTPYFLKAYRTSAFFDQYNRENPRHHLSEEKFKLIEGMIMHHPHVNRLLADIVSSQLDADRLDYLLRDSHFCGVTYGEYDLRWMLNSMTIVNSPIGERLGLTHKGIGVAEHYLMARRLMIRNIYHHQKKLALEYFLIQLLTYLAESLSSYAPFQTLKTTRLGYLLLEINAFNQKVREGGDIPTLKQTFLENNFENYKELSDYDVFAVIKHLAHSKDAHPAAQLAARIHYRHMPKIIRLDPHHLTSIQDWIHSVQHDHKDTIQPWQLALIQTPHQSYSVEDDPILVSNELHQVKPLNEHSLMIHAISDKYEHTAFLCIDHALLDHPAIRTLTEKSV